MMPARELARTLVQIREDLDSMNVPDGWHFVAVAIAGEPCIEVHWRNHHGRMMVYRWDFADTEEKERAIRYLVNLVLEEHIKGFFELGTRTVRE